MKHSVYVVSAVIKFENALTDLLNFKNKLEDILQNDISISEDDRNILKESLEKLNFSK